MSSFTTEVLYRVYDDTVGAYVQVAPDPDTGQLVRITTHNDNKADWYPTVDLILCKEQAIMVAQAILCLAEKLP